MENCLQMYSCLFALCGWHILNFDFAFCLLLFNKPFLSMLYSQVNKKDDRSRRRFLFFIRQLKKGIYLQALTTFCTRITAIFLQIAHLLTDAGEG